MNFLNNVMSKVAMNKLKHERQMAALIANCHASNEELVGIYSCEDAASQCFYSSFQLNS